MEIATTPRTIENDPSTSGLIGVLQEREDEFGLAGAILYHEFPLYRDEEGGLITSKVLVVSPNHGVMIFQTVDAEQVRDPESLKVANESLELIFSHVFSRLIKNRLLRRSKQELKFPIIGLIYAPGVDVRRKPTLDEQTTVILSDSELAAELEVLLDPPLDTETFQEIKATVEGAKGLIRPQKRKLEGKSPTSKGAQVSRLEQEIANFDKQQRHGYLAVLDGPQRIRGLAGSGKTVVLAMKAALTHLKHPDATIVYTYSTRSLFQHIQRLITRFYRQFDDRDPDWNRLKIMHAWGGATPGVYSSACGAHGLPALTFSAATYAKAGGEFDYVCTRLLEEVRIRPQYDFMFVDEGQDFPPSFLRLCVALAESQRVVWAYDELQTIFRPSAPTPAEIFGTDENGRALIDLSDDVILHKCYRNPREILIVAHALGFGIYGERVVQMLENEDHWSDIGYRVTRGPLEQGVDVEIERPEDNSPSSISRFNSIDEIVSATICNRMEDEVEFVVRSIERDLNEGLRPDDIMVATVDDRHARDYLQHVSEGLKSAGIQSHNVHAASTAAEFSYEDHVTLSTVHKAKGNEAYMVYVIGTDALFNPRPTVRTRNILFTAMTRAKAWVRVSGVRSAAFKEEIDAAKLCFPYLRFVYPSPEELKIMRRDLEEEAVVRLKLERMLEEVAQGMSREEIEAALDRLQRRSSRVVTSHGVRRKRKK